MTYLQIQLPTFVLALVANITLAMIVLQYATKNRSRILFCLFVITQMFWITSNYFAFQVPQNYFLFASRLTMLFATFHALLFYLFIDNFLNKQEPDYKGRIIPSVVIGVLVGLISLSGLIFSRLDFDINGNLAPKAGPLIGLFGAFVSFFLIAGFYIMDKRFKKAIGEEKSQWKFLRYGFILTFLLVVLFSFVNFIFFKNVSGVQFGHLYTLPFVAFTAYAMIKHKLLNIKTVLAEIMVIFLNAIIFIQLINSESVVQLLISVLVQIGTLIVGILLIKGVEKEVKQREQLEVLSKELADANNKLTALDRARAEFISIASHQLRTPPATVKWYLSAALAGDYGKLNPDVAPVIEKAAMTNNHLISLIEDMLNVSRIERGKMEFLFEQVNVEELARVAYETLIPQAANKKLNLNYLPPKDKFPLVMSDKEKLKQVMNNLIDNAIKYTKQGTIAVSIYQKGGDICFAVKDSGKGINKEDSQNIFQKYSRGKESIKQSAGLGLGLYVAKIIVEQHKGKIWAESEGEGKGSTFLFSIPIKNDLKETTLVDLTQDHK